MRPLEARWGRAGNGATDGARADRARGEARRQAAAAGGEPRAGCAGADELGELERMRLLEGVSRSELTRRALAACEG